MSFPFICSLRLNLFKHIESFERRADAFNRWIRFFSAPSWFSPAWMLNCWTACLTRTGLSLSPTGSWWNWHRKIRSLRSPGRAAYQITPRQSTFTRAVGLVLAISLPALAFHVNCVCCAASPKLNGKESIALPNKGLGNRQMSAMSFSTELVTTESPPDVRRVTLNIKTLPGYFYPLAKLSTMRYTAAFHW